LFCAVALTSGCGNSRPDARAEHGTISVALTGSSNSGVRYRLRDADFSISGASELVLSSESDLDAEELAADLPAGDYQVALEEGWSLERETDAGFQAVEAELTSDNPVDFEILDGQNTFVSFRFQAGELVNMGEGSLGIGIEIDDGPPLSDVASGLDGALLTLSCIQHTSIRTCLSSPAGACPRTDDPVLTGALTTDTTVELGGEPGVLYDVRLRVVGLVEGKPYVGGTDQSSGVELPADGFRAGGRPDNQSNGYSAYMIRTTSPAQDYFLNSIAVAGDNRVRHSTFPIDYEATIRVEGGSSVRLVVADPNCSAIKNCADPDNGSQCIPQIIELPPVLEEKLGSQPFDGQFAGLEVLDVTEVQ
jgi:hypothetical protein